MVLSLSASSSSSFLFSDWVSETVFSRAVTLSVSCFTLYTKGVRVVSWLVISANISSTDFFPLLAIVKGRLLTVFLCG